jgi:hypothetical protein
MERRRLGGMGAGPHDKRFRAEKRINIRKSSAASPGGLGAGPHDIGPIEQAPTFRVYTVTLLLYNMSEYCDFGC